MSIHRGGRRGFILPPAHYFRRLSQTRRMTKYDFLRRLDNFADMKERTLDVGGTEVAVYFLDPMCSSDKITRFVTEPLLSLGRKATVKNCLEKIIYGADCVATSDADTLVEEFLDGKTVLFIGGDDTAIAVDTKGIEYRAVAEPPTSMVTKGPREGFNENIKTNLMLLRKRIKTPDFKTENIKVGDKTGTLVSVCYIEGAADKKVVDAVVKKISGLKLDGVLDSSYIAAFLDVDPTNLFKTVGSVEKPDIVASKLLEGKVAVAVDGSPLVLTLPYTFIEDMHSPDDYYYNTPQTATVARILRLIAMTAAVLLPAIYVALQVFHYQMLPSKFLITIISSVQGIPFPPMLEMLVVILLFDVLREANARMPQIAGLSLSIVGAIILGDAAVKAGLLSAPAVMIGAMSGIGLYTMPDNTMLFMLLRLAFTLLGGTVGIVGILLGAMLTVSYVVSLDDYGMPYLSPLSPPAAAGDDGIIKMPQDAILKDK